MIIEPPPVDYPSQKTRPAASIHHIVNRPGALAIIRDDFESVTPLVTINSTVHEAFDLRTANTLYKAGFNTVRDVANSTEGVLLTLPGFQSKTVADIIARVKSIVSQKADDQK